MAMNEVLALVPERALQPVTDEDLDLIVRQCLTAMGLGGLDDLTHMHPSPVCKAQLLSLVVELQTARLRICLLEEELRHSQEETLMAIEPEILAVPDLSCPAGPAA